MQPREIDKMLFRLFNNILIKLYDPNVNHRNIKSETIINSVEIKIEKLNNSLGSNKLTNNTNSNPK